MDALAIVLLILACFLLVFVVIPIWIRVYATVTTGICKSKRRLDGLVVIVTGSNIGIGYETAKDLAYRGAKVIMACRSMDKGTRALEELKRETKSDKVFLKKLDLSSLKSVRQFCAEIIEEEPRLDILVNNAGAETMTKTLTEDGLETNFAANHFGPFLLTNLLLDLMKKTGNARIVMVSSMMHLFPRQLDLDNLNSEKSWNPDMVYSNTKLANVLMMRELHRRLQLAGVNSITVNALHPGAVRTGFLRYSNEIWYRRIFTGVAQLFFKNAWEGAQTQIYLSVSEDVEGVSGLYYSDCKKASISKLGQDAQLAMNLWSKSEVFVNLQSHETIFETNNISL